MHKSSIEIEGNDAKLAIIGRFSDCQSLSIIQELKNMGVGLKILKSNKWELLNEYKLPFERFVTLYDDEFKISDLGVF